MKIFYFSANGNCLAVAKKIGGEPIPIPQALHDTEPGYRDDTIGFVFPVFVATYPRIIKELLGSKKFEADYFFVIVTYGSFPGNTLAAFQKLAKRHGIRIDYSAELKMVDNYLPLFNVEKEIRKIPNKHIDENLSRIKTDILSGKRELTKNTIVKNIVAFVEKPVLMITNSGRAARGFSVSDACIRCGTCSRVCPAGNIAVSDKVAFGNRCYSCFACIHACPKTAIHIKFEKGSKRWRNPDVKLKELIDANQQKN